MTVFASVKVEEKTIGANGEKSLDYGKKKWYKKYYKKKQGGMFRRGNCHVKIIKTFAHKAGVFCLMPQSSIVSEVAKWAEKGKQNE